MIISKFIKALLANIFLIYSECVIYIKLGEQN